MNNSHLPLQDGHTYVDAVGRSYRIGGTCRDYSEWVWSLNGWWFVRATGQHIHGYECRQTGKWVHRIGSLRDIVGESKRERPEDKENL